jgi:hypothetical protein
MITVLIFTNAVFAQQGDNGDLSFRDSVYRYQGINPAMKFYDNSFDIFIPYDFSLLNTNQLAEGDTATLWLRTELALSYSSDSQFGSSIDEDYIMMPFYKQYLKNSKINPIQYVLGIAQTAAVGYMVYRRIKKYGFF